MNEPTIRMPKGVRMPHGKVKIAVVIDKALFDDVILNARKNKIGFSDSINDVAKCGILCLRETDESNWITKRPLNCICGCGVNFGFEPVETVGE